MKAIISEFNEKTYSCEDQKIQLPTNKLNIESDFNANSKVWTCPETGIYAVNGGEPRLIKKGEKIE